MNEAEEAAAGPSISRLFAQDDSYWSPLYSTLAVETRTSQG
jgi:hypothetical protein